MLQGLTVDAPAFERFMQEQRDRARGARKDRTAQDNDVVAALVERGLSSEFTGYAELETDAQVLAILKDGKPADALSAGESADLLLSKTPFYGESGGQVGDTGILTAPGGDLRFDVADTRKPALGILLHRGKLAAGTLRPGDWVHAAVDAGRRAAIRRNHTATHLLNAALKQVVGTTSIRQAGSYVAPDRLRFDFTGSDALTRDQLAAVERTVAGYVCANAGVRTYEIPLKDVPGSGIVAVFDEKYGDIVRVVDVDGISKELCGGTHAARTGDIGAFRILAESSVAAGVRRIEDQTGPAAADHTLAEHDALDSVAARLSVSPAEVPARVEALAAQVQKLEK